MWVSCTVSPGMPLTAVFGFLLSLASFILFVANIYNSTRAQPAEGTFQLSVCLVKPQARLTRVAGIIYLFIAVVSRRLLSDKQLFHPWKKVHRKSAKLLLCLLGLCIMSLEFKISSVPCKVLIL